MQKAVEQTFTILFLQEAQLSQSDRAMLCVIEYSAKSLEVTHGHSKWYPWEGRISITSSSL